MITVQPINGADDNLNKLTKESHADDISQVFSDSFTYSKNATAQSETNVDKSKIHYRGVAKTNVDLAPQPSSSPSSANDGSISISSSSSNNNNIKNSAQSNFTYVNANLSPAKEHNAAKLTLSKSALEKLKTLNNSMPKPVLGVTSTISITTTTSSTSTTTTTTTTSKPTTTTTLVPKKPLITYAVEDIPGLLSKTAEQQPHSSLKESPAEEVGNDGPLSLQSSETITYQSNKSNPNFVMAMIGIIFVIPIIIVVTNCTVRKVRDVWTKRKYRRMDYLIEDMYN